MHHPPAKEKAWSMEEFGAVEASSVVSTSAFEGLPASVNRDVAQDERRNAQVRSVASDHDWLWEQAGCALHRMKPVL